MNPVHFHLLVNHLPVVGLLVGLVLGVLCLFIPKWPFRRLVYGLVAVSGVLGPVASQTGEGAEAAIDRSHYAYPYSEAYLEQHEETGEAAGLVMLVIGVLALTAWVLHTAKPRAGRWVFPAMVAVSAIGTLAGLNAAATGGAFVHGSVRESGWVRPDGVPADAAVRAPKSAPASSTSSSTHESYPEVEEEDN